MSGEPEFGGVIGRDFSDSEPWWPPEPEPPANAPNVLFVVLDDVGFAQLGCYGSDIATPNIDRLAAGGVRLSNFHTDRAVLADALVPPHRPQPPPQRHGPGRRPRVRLPRVLGRHPPRERVPLRDPPRARGTRPTRSASGTSRPTTRRTWRRSRARWPLGRGFDRWYGFHGGETHQFVPTLYCDNHSVPPPRTIDDGYHLSADLADRAIEFLSDLRNVDHDQPFFCTSRPARATRRTTRRPSGSRAYRGQFDDGWDAWRERDVRPPARRRHHPAGNRAVTAARVGAGVGRPARARPGGRGAVHGVLRRVPLVHRRRRSAACSTSSSRPATSTTR